MPAADGASYLLGFVEFDDQGQIWDRKQMWAVIDSLNAEAAEKDLLMVVFAHGWKHSAAAGDGNIETFRKVLGASARMSCTSAARPAYPRAGSSASISAGAANR